MVISETLVPRNLIEVKELASFLAASDLIPKSLLGRKENVALVLLMGHEIGCGGVAALRNIYVVNGRPAIYGDLATALVRKSGLCEELEYSFEGAGDKMKCIAVGKRKGMKNSHSEEFSYSDAVFGGLVERNPNYKKFPKDMVMWKALHRLYKFLWPDVLHGISIKETVMDEIPEAEVEMGKIEIVKPAKPEPKVPAPAPEVSQQAEIDLKAKAEAEKARVAAEEAKEKAKAEKKAKKAEAPAPEKPAEPAEEELKEEPAAEATPVNRVIGTLLKAIKLSNTDTGAALGFALVVQSSEGEQKFMVEKYEDIMEYKKNQNKTVEILWAPRAIPIASVVGIIIKCSAVNP